MSNYLVIAHQTASSPELVSGLLDLRQQDPDAQFILVVPETPLGELDSQALATSWQVAKDAAMDAKADFEYAGLSVIEAKVGDRSPLRAAEEEFQYGGRVYEAVAVCTFPPGISRWLKLDLPHQVERKLQLPVIHIVAEPSRVTA